jgi:hypothetical protein
LTVNEGPGNLLDATKSPPLNFPDNGRFPCAGRSGNYMPVGLMHGIRLLPAIVVVIRFQVNVYKFFLLISFLAT